MHVQERRRSTRISVSLPVIFQTADGSVASGTIENLSESGMLLVANADVPPNSEVRILFGEDNASHAIEIRGNVVRSSPIGEFGLSFIDLSARAMDAIRDAMMHEA
jgi:c-di-GMP-binding flagellar brake protein YcgR